MFDDFELPGFDDLLDLLDVLGSLIGLDADELAMLDEPAVSLWPDAGAGVVFFDVDEIWTDPDLPVYGQQAFSGAFGTLELPNPFLGDPGDMSQGADMAGPHIDAGGPGMTEHEIAKLSVDTGIDIPF